MFSYDVTAAILVYPFPSYLVSVSKRVLVQNLSLKNEFDLHENDDVGGTRFHTNGFGFKWQNPTRKWSIKRRPCWFPAQFLNFKLVT